jgi:hypothetical protein
VLDIGIHSNVMYKKLLGKINTELTAQIEANIAISGYDE